MTNPTAFTAKPESATPRSTRSAAIFEDWMLELVLVAGAVAAMIQGVLSLNGSMLG
jgi:hypothetical protein